MELEDEDPQKDVSIEIIIKRESQDEEDNNDEESQEEILEGASEVDMSAEAQETIIKVEKTDQTGEGRSFILSHSISSPVKLKVICNKCLL